MLGLNPFHLYPSSIWDDMCWAYQEWFKNKGPESSSTVIVATFPLLDSTGRLLHTVCFNQLFYDDKGDYLWSISSLEHWSAASKEEVEEVEVEDGRVEEEKEEIATHTASCSMLSDLGQTVGNSSSYDNSNPLDILDEFLNNEGTTHHHHHHG